MTLFAGQLDGAVSLGDALRNAKQQYFASQGLYGAYDEKALSSTILYGLPMFAVGTERPVRPTPPTADHDPDRPTVCRRRPTARTSRSIRQSGDIGRWFEADAGTGPQLPQITASRPVATPRRARRHGRRRRQLAAAGARRRRQRCCTPARPSPTSTPPSAARRSTTRPASPRRSTPSPRSRHGWPASRRPATTRA